MWNRGKDFLKKAGLFIFTFVILIWFLSRFGVGPSGQFGFLGEDELLYSPLAAVGQFIQPLFALHGYSWEWVVALFTGFIAKEIVVGTVGTLFPTTGGLEAAVTGLGPIVSFSYLLFTLLYLPCVATLPVMKRELNSWKLLLFSIVISLAVPYMLSLGVSLLRFI
jgi:ferrous iron transport protein B